MEYISEVPCLEAVKVLGQAWEEQYLESQGKKKSNMPLSLGEKDSNTTTVDPNLPNVWDGKKDGTAHNAESFMQMLASTR